MRPKFGFSSEKIDALLSRLREPQEMSILPRFGESLLIRTTINSSPGLLRQGPITSSPATNEISGRIKSPQQKRVIAGEPLNIITRDL